VQQKSLIGIAALLSPFLFFQAFEEGSGLRRQSYKESKDCNKKQQK
jgi:hypothetical protein